MGFLIPIGVLILIVIGVILYFTVTEYRPKATEDSIMISSESMEELARTFTLTTYNIGFCSLDQSRDFFMDGGQHNYSTTQQEVEHNLREISNQLKGLSSDFYFLQEVDTHGSRSHHINQADYIINELTEYGMAFSYNYRSKWIPLPIRHPLGSVYSGLMTLSKQPFQSSIRIHLDGQEKYPFSMFYLKRCMQVNEFKCGKNQQLYLINIHLSAYDKEGKYRSRQINHIYSYINRLFNKGNNYVVVGGDFNLLLDSSKFEDNMPEWVSVLPEYVEEGVFQIAVDSRQTSVRSLDIPYRKGTNFETYIDGFLVSPNIKIHNITTHDFGFQYSDHNPTTITIELI